MSESEESTIYLIPGVGIRTKDLTNMSLMS